MQQTAFPTENLGAATLPTGTRVIRIDAGQLASVPDNAAGLIATQKVLQCSAPLMIIVFNLG